MKKYLSLAVVLVVATGISLGFRHAVSGTSEASRREPSYDRFDRASRLKLADRMQGPVEGASLAVMPAGTGSGDEKFDLVCAGGAAATGDRLVNRARQSPDNPHLLRQAAAHYRAALAYEPTVRDADGLFASVRSKLIGLDREIVRLDRPGVVKPTLPPAVVETLVSKPETPAPVVLPPVAVRPEAIMVGPDGVEIRRVVPRE